MTNQAEATSEIDASTRKTKESALVEGCGRDEVRRRSDQEQVDERMVRTPAFLVYSATAVDRSSSEIFDAFLVTNGYVVPIRENGASAPSSPCEISPWPGVSATATIEPRGDFLYDAPAPPNPLPELVQALLLHSEAAADGIRARRAVATLDIRLDRKREKEGRERVTVTANLNVRAETDEDEDDNAGSRRIECPGATKLARKLVRASPSWFDRIRSISLAVGIPFGRDSAHDRLARAYEKAAGSLFDDAVNARQLTDQA
jgi:hypothetical protein